ncbi:MAG: hypothetical protein K6A67_11305 [Bacteroidales bacterium]|nr:hypothetical protein [Bacteroidales bacterium]
MNKKDFYADIKALHQTIVQEIMNLMNAHGVTEVDFMGSDADGGYVYCYPSDDVDAESMAVMSVSIKDGHLYLDLCRDIDTEELASHNENGDTNEAFPTYRADDTFRVKACAGIELVYDSVWQILEQGK